MNHFVTGNILVVSGNLYGACEKFSICVNEADTGSCLAGFALFALSLGQK